MNVLNTINCGVEIDVLLPNLVSLVIKIITIAIPIILIIMSMMDLVKAIMSEDEQKKAINKLVSRIKYAVLIFLLPTIVTFVLGLVVTDDHKFQCVDCFIKGNCANSIENDNNSEDNEETKEDDTSKDNEESKGETPVKKNEITILTIFPTSGTIEVGKSLNLSSNVRNVTYTSSNERIITVTKKGVIKANRKGNAFIVAESGDGQKVQIPITVVDSKNEKVSIEKLDYEESNHDMIVGEKQSYKPETTPSNADTSTIQYTSSKPKVATIDSNGIVTALSEGTTTIKAVSGKLKSTVKINVVKQDITIPVKSIKVESSIGLKVGETKQLSPVIKPSDATNQTIHYSSEKPSIASINENGTIQALSEGTTNIITKVDGKIAITKIKVSSNEVVLKSITLTQSKATLSVNTTYKIETKLKPSNTTNKKLTYSSSNSKVAEVSEDGTVSAKKSGKATITIKSSNNKTAKFEVTVVEQNKIHFIKTSPSSDCILLESNGKYALIDTGRKRDYSAIKNYLDELNVTKLEFLLLTHNHGDHTGSAASIIKKYKPTTLYLKKYYGNDIAGTNGSFIQEEADKNMERYHQYLNAAKNVGTKIVYLDGEADGYSITLNNMKLKNYNLTNYLTNDSNYSREASENINSITTLIEVNKIKTYLTADLTDDYIADEIARKIGKVAVYKVIHHAYENGTSEVEAGILKPKYAIITNTREILNSKPETSVSRVTKYTIGNKVYYSGENTIVVDYSSGKVKITKK